MSDYKTNVTKINLIDAMKDVDKASALRKKSVIEHYCNILNIGLNQPHDLVLYSLNMDYITIDEATELISLLNDKLISETIKIALKGQGK